MFTLKEKIFQFLMIAVGTLFLAAGLHLFLIPNVIAPGGVTGFAVVMQQLIGVPVSMMNLLINIPLFLWALKTLGSRFGAKTALGTVLLSVFLILFERWGSFNMTQDLLLASIFGGILNGVGLGIVFRFGGSTGGTDLAGAVLNKFFPSLSIAKLMMGLDMFVVVFAGVVNRNVEISLYSLIALYVIVKSADFITEGLDYSKSFTIITSRPEEIAEELFKLGRGVTLLKGQGMYTGDERNVLMCVVYRSQIGKVKQLIDHIDPKAFVMVATTHEVLGEGFKRAQSA